MPRVHQASKDAVVSFRSGLATQISGSVVYLNSTINWSVSLVLAGIASFGLSDKVSVQDRFYFQCAIIVFLIHFFSRSCKAYLNVIRFSVLDRETIRFLKNGQHASAAELINSLYVEWKSPLPLSLVLQKCTFELGYVYFFAITISHAAYLMELNTTSLLVMGLTLIICAFEIWIGVLRSPYFRTPHQSTLARESR